MRRLPSEATRLSQADKEDISAMYVEPADEYQKRIGDAIPALAEGNDRWRIEAERQLEVDTRHIQMVREKIEAARLRKAYRRRF